MEADGTMRAKLKELYDAGYKLKWKVPTSDTAEVVEPAAALAGALSGLEIKEGEEAEEDSMQDYM